MRRVLRPLRLTVQRLRFRAWVLRSRLELRRHGGRLVVEAPHGARFHRAPRLQITPQHLSKRIRAGSRAVTTVRIATDVDLGDGTTIEVRPEGENLLELDEGVYFLSGARVVLFDGEVRLGHGVRVRDNSLLKSAGSLRVGARSSIGYGAMLHCADEIVLEDLVGIAERVSLLDSDHLLDGSDTYNQELPVATAAIRIERNALVGANAVVLRGARIGRNSVVAAGAVVRGGDYPAAWVIGGIPARPLKALGVSAAQAPADGAADTVRD